MSTTTIVCIIVQIVCLFVCFWFWRLAVKADRKVKVKLERAKFIHDAAEVLNDATNDLLKCIDEHIEREEVKKKPKQNKVPTAYERMPDTFTRREGAKILNEIGNKRAIRCYINDWLRCGMIEAEIDSAGIRYKKTRKAK